jgi:hypothetical protein
LFCALGDDVTAGCGGVGEIEFFVEILLIKLIFKK